MDRDEAMRLLRGGPAGVAEWNRRRAAGEEICDLNAANLERASLDGANLERASLDGASLIAASLIMANLERASLIAANLKRASLRGAHLNEANLERASLHVANLNGADLANARFAGASCGATVFVGVDLSDVEGLDSIQHSVPSSLGTDTIILSRGKIPEVFLRGCGLPDAWIANIPALIGSLEPIQFYSVFISYSVKDSSIVERLHVDLQAKGVRCWYAPEDLKIGERIRVGIDEAIRIHDKLLLVLSKHAVESQWVEKEVETAMEKERRQKRTVLFPVRLDDAVMKVEVGWAADLRRSRYIGDFRKWKDHDSYTRAFERLMRDLKAE